MKTIFFLLLATSAHTANLPPTPFPVFLRAGFSSVLEFEEAPSKVVLGDPQRFQVEKLEKSLVIKTLAAYAATNMFVYFRAKEPRLFVLTASEEAQPTFYKNFEPPPVPPKAAPNAPASPPPKMGPNRGRVLTSKFDDKKDYLTVEFLLIANSGEPLRPVWGSARLKFNDRTLPPSKLWAERKEIQKDAQVKARLIFAKPNVPRNLSGVSIIVPLEGRLEPIRLPLAGGSR